MVTHTHTHIHTHTHTHTHIHIHTHVVMFLYFLQKTVPILHDKIGSDQRKMSPPNMDSSKFSKMDDNLITDSCESSV